MSDDNRLTTAATGKRLGVAPKVVVQWVQAGRINGRRDSDRWRVDPASVEDERQRLSRASWWRRVDMRPGRAEGVQQSATKRLLKAASAWRRHSKDPQLTDALIAAIGERESLSIRTKMGAKNDIRVLGRPTRRLRRLPHPVVGGRPAAPSMRLPNLIVVVAISNEVGSRPRDGEVAVSGVA
jgi:hypothetical protein